MEKMTFDCETGETNVELLSQAEIEQINAFKTEQETISLNSLKQTRKAELIQLMNEANALRDDAKWQLYKTEYDSL